MRSIVRRLNGKLALVVVVGMTLSVGAMALTPALVSAQGTTTPTPNPGLDSFANSNNTAQDTNTPTLACEFGFSNNPLAWFICPVVSALQWTVNSLNGGIDAMLTVDTNKLMNPQLHAAWGQFRLISVGFIVIAGLIMLGAQAFGLEIFDAYTVRKMLPRLIIAVILISISWTMMKFLIDLSNDVGNSVRAIIYQPFKTTPGIGGQAIQMGQWSAFLGELVAGAAFFALGPAALASFLVTAALAVGVAFFVLLLRQLIFMALVATAPFWLSMRVLPNTNDVYEFGKKASISMLVVFPIISGIIAFGRVFAVLSFGNNTVPTILAQAAGFVAFFIPYFLIPFAFRWAGGLVATLGGIANDSGRGAFDRVSGFRTNQAAKRYQDAKGGRGGYVGANVAGRAYRRATMGGNALTRRGRAHYRGQVTALMQGNAEEILKKDNGRMANDDAANTLALQGGMNRGRFIRQYAAMQGVSTGEARDALGELEASYGARLGSGAMRTAAYKARAASVTGYGAGDYEAMTRDADSMTQSGLMTRSDAVSALKSNKSRSDINGPGFNAWMTQLANTRTQLEAGGPAVTGAQATAMRQSALQGSPAANIVSGRREAVQALAPQMMQNLRDVNTRMAAAPSGSTAYVNEQMNMQRQLASIAGRYDAMAQVAPQNAEEMANRILSNRILINGRDATVREHIEQSRSDPEFLNMRREYSNLSGYVGGGGGGGGSGTP